VSAVLLDTHVLLWLRTTPERIPAPALATLMSPDTELLVSAASSWEIAIKYRLGKLQLPSRPQLWIPRALRELAATPIDVDHESAAAVAALPDHHRDPFDRLLVVQARQRRIRIATADHAFAPYDVRTLAV